MTILIVAGLIAFIWFKGRVFFAKMWLAFVAFAICCAKWYEGKVAVDKPVAQSVDKNQEVSETNDVSRK